MIIKKNNRINLNSNLPKNPSKLPKIRDCINEGVPKIELILTPIFPKLSYLYYFISLFFLSNPVAHHVGEIKND